MPRAKSDTAKSSAELGAEIEAMKKALAEKQKAAQAARRKEKAEAEQARAIEEAEFNKDFVEASKEIHLSDYEDNGQTIYEMVRSIIRPPVSPDPVQVKGDNGSDVPTKPVQVPGDVGRHTDPMQGAILR